MGEHKPQYLQMTPITPMAVLWTQGSTVEPFGSTSRGCLSISQDDSSRAGPKLALRSQTQLKPHPTEATEFEKPA